MVIYWDTSAIIPILVKQAETLRITKFMKGNESFATSFFTHFEVQSTLQKKFTLKLLSRTELEETFFKWAKFSELLSFRAVDQQVVHQGLRLQRAYGTKTYDSVHLGTAAALQAAETDVLFLTLDGQLAKYAKQEGFSIL